jgi:hypothetical protein
LLKNLEDFRCNIQFAAYSPRLHAKEYLYPKKFKNRRNLKNFYHRDRRAHREEIKP